MREVFARKPYAGTSLYGGNRPPATSPSDRNAYAKPFIASADRAGNKPSISLGRDIGSEGSLDYGVGDTVRHVKFGDGVVISIEKGARDYEVTVDFKGYGVKRMLAGFAKFKKIE